MDIGKIETILAELELKDLYAIELLVAELIESARSTQMEIADGVEGQERRQEKRFEANIMATLQRITDIRPGERKEWHVNILDVSRTGMCFKVDTNFIPSRVVQLTFSKAGGRIKQVFMEVVRMKKMCDQDGQWIEVGCQSISDDAVARLRLQEERVSRMRAKLHNRKGIFIMVVGPDTEDTEKITLKIKDEGYQVKQHKSLEDAIKDAERLSAQLLIICQGSGLARNARLLKTALSGPSQLATLALLQNDKDGFELFKAGIDECLLQSKTDEFLFRAIERALIGHLTRYSLAGRAGSSQALLVSRHNNWINLVNFYLGELGFRCQAVRDPAAADEQDLDEFKLLFMDFEPQTLESFQRYCREHTNLPVIALCGDIGAGHQAMAHGAKNYLCMPPDREDVRMILEGTVAQQCVLR